MSGCFGSSPYDRWMERQLDDYLASTEPDGSGEVEFTTKLRGGTVKVQAEAEREYWEDEDGKGSSLSIDLKCVNWTFHPDAEVDLTDDEEDQLKEEAEEIAMDF